MLEDFATVDRIQLDRGKQAFAIGTRRVLVLRVAMMEVRNTSSWKSTGWVPDYARELELEVGVLPGPLLSHYQGGTAQAR